MSARKRLRQKGRREGGGFVAVPFAVMESENWRRCSATGIKLLMDLACQYRGRNNGDLAPSLVKWGPASETRVRALRELVHYGLLIQTKHGGLGMPSLYALTWHAIDHCDGKLEVLATDRASGDWKDARAAYAPQKSAASLRKSKEPASKIEAATPVTAPPRFENRTFAAGFGDGPASKIEHLSRNTMGVQVERAHHR